MAVGGGSPRSRYTVFNYLLKGRRVPISSQTGQMGWTGQMDRQPLREARGASRASRGRAGAQDPFGGQGGWGAPRSQEPLMLFGLGVWGS